MDQVGLDANISLDDLKSSTAGKRQNKNKASSYSSGSSAKAFLNSRSSNNNNLQAADYDNVDEQKLASMEAVSTSNPTEINKRYNCMTNDEKLKKECWRMRKVHEDKMKEFEMQWINSSRRLNVPKDDNNFKNSEGEHYEHKVVNLERQQQPVIVTSSGVASSLSNSGIEAMCLPGDLDDFTPNKQPPPEILIKNFTCMSSKSRRLKKEMKRMRKITLESLSSSFTTENDEHGDSATAAGSRTFMSRQDNVGQGLILMHRCIY
mmetsp:Transcript_27924/g.43364  ORF Transcript_27924/g.43364 Transcript_27924/m.43364 type:complete len:263 (+) Transcript_27924:88-876(+)